MEFKGFLFGLGVVFSIITAAIIFILGCAIIFITADYYLSESYCTAYVDNKEVYTGRCHFLEIDSIGENGNTKHLAIYKDIIKFKCVKEYVSEDIKVVSIGD